MNTVDTERLEQLRAIGVPFAGATNDDIRVFDCRILLEWATSLTNEAELRGRVDELEQFEPLFKGDHTKCIDPMSCIGYQNAQSDFDNEKQIRLEKLREANI